ncbi:hypothetical protein [Microbacterium marinilacus]|uniref:Uncharacterized protein n=1 Tax=Microbacterium marinilacus TaxID=415209 RepID=A0ABP7B3Y7_9MICO|nr:hypothetical protein [Microbacterium marinilacus]MBY0688014.1 hypothetical protein [Microbacterium marinilacus]
MDNTAFAPDVPVAAPALRGRERLARAGAALWRVVAPDDRVIGHLRQVDHPLGVRFRAERLQLPPRPGGAAGRFVEVGEFWGADEAVASLRS